MTISTASSVILLQVPYCAVWKSDSSRFLMVERCLTGRTRPAANLLRSNRFIRFNLLLRNTLHSYQLTPFCWRAFRIPPQNCLLDQKSFAAWTPSDIHRLLCVPDKKDQHFWIHNSPTGTAGWSASCELVFKLGVPFLWRLEFQTWHKLSLCHLSLADLSFRLRDC